MLLGWPCLLPGNTLDWRGPRTHTSSVAGAVKISIGARFSLIVKAAIGRFNSPAEILSSC